MKKSGYLAQSLDNERKARRGFGKGIGGPTPTPVRPGVDPEQQMDDQDMDSQEDNGPNLGGPARTPVRPGVSPAPRHPFQKRGGNQATGAQRGRKPPAKAQGPNKAPEIGVRSRPTSL